MIWKLTLAYLAGLLSAWVLDWAWERWARARRPHPTAPTLLEQIARTDPHGGIGAIADELTKRQPILRDAVFPEPGPWEKEHATRELDRCIDDLRARNSRLCRCGCKALHHSQLDGPCLTCGCEGFEAVEP